MGAGCEYGRLTLAAAGLLLLFPHRRSACCMPAAISLASDEPTSRIDIRLPSFAGVARIYRRRVC